MRWIPYREAMNELFDHQRDRLRRNHERLDDIVWNGYTGLAKMTAEDLGREYERVFGEAVRIAIDRSSPGDEEEIVA